MSVEQFINKLSEEASVAMVVAFLGSIGTVLLTKIWKKYVKPNIEDYLYREHRLDDEQWVVSVDENKNWTGDVKISQKGNSVWGEISDNKKPQKFWDFSGKYRDGILTGAYSRRGNSTDRGTFTLMTLFSGSVLRGRYAWHNGVNEIISGSYLWSKVSFKKDCEEKLWRASAATEVAPGNKASEDDLKQNPDGKR